MNVPPESPASALATPGAQPKPKQKRRRCRNCDTRFELTKPNRLFCSIDCKNEYNHYGAAFGPLKTKIEKMVKRLVSDQITAFMHAQQPPVRSESELAIRRLLKSFYARVHVLEQAVANTSAAAAANARGFHQYATKAKPSRVQYHRPISTKTPGGVRSGRARTLPAPRNRNH